MKKPEFGNQDSREKARELTEDEKKRLEKFEEISKDLTGQGYTRVELTVGIVKANIFALVLFVPLLIIGMGLLILRNGGLTGRPEGGTFLLFMVVFEILIVVHELIHGVSWAIFQSTTGRIFRSGS